MSRAELELLQRALSQPSEREPVHRQMQQGVPLVDRMRSPAAVLLRQIRLEKLRILEALLAS
jgi:hypothetical protein